MNRSAPALLAVLLSCLTHASAQFDDGQPVARASRVEPYIAAEADRLDAYLRFLASDAMGGRDTGTPQGEITAEYVAASFRAAGLQPAGDDGTFMQRYALRRTRFDLDSLALRLVDEAGSERASFAALEEFVLSGPGADDLQLSAPLVFAGYGVHAPELGHDDLAGLPVEGAFVVVLSGGPESRTDLGGRTSWYAKRRALRNLGAAGMVVVDEPGDALGQRWIDAVHATTTVLAEQLEPTFLLVQLVDAGAARLFAAAGRDLSAEREAHERGEGQGFVVSGLRLEASGRVEAEDLSGLNVAALLPGSHPTLADDVIVVTAHMDHVGIDEAGNVFNGADDNATGTTTLMMVAEGLAARPPLPRSVLFLALSGEEKGLLGSEYWVAHPTVELGRLVANINIDMVGRNDSGSIGVTPSPEHAEYNSLVPLAVELGELAGLGVSWFAGEGRLRRRVDDYYDRSDHANFAAAGVPVIFFFAGEHEDYHRPSDDVEKLDQGKVARAIDLIGRLVRAVATDPEKPARLAR